jgi:dipeptidyl aminopeptidase/acylaminoacyl peptidase
MPIRILFTALFLLIALCGCSRGPSTEYASLSDARKAIPTKLTRQGPPPENEWEPETPPDGVKEVTYKSGSLELKGWLGVPEGAQNCPALVFAHGGFAFAGSDFDTVAYWVRAGWVVFVPTLRAENGGPGNYDLFYGEIDDLIAAGNYVARLKEVDPKAVFVAGHSVGGTRAVLASMLPGPFCAAAGVGAATDVGAWLEGQEELAPFDISNEDEIYVRSPRYHVRSIHMPVILVRGKMEYWNWAMTDQFVTDAKTAGKDVTSIVVTGDHFTCLSQAMREVQAAFSKIARR